jgi:hypothetical protein
MPSVRSVSVYRRRGGMGELRQRYADINAVQLAGCTRGRNGRPLVLCPVLALRPADGDGLRLRAGRVDERPLGEEVKAVQQNYEVIVDL